ncbi:transposase [Thermoactinomyces sp. CICC 10522]|jgi:transposase|uniref:transposase n=1 Tax=Thermoactinomyces sp. CICC 10522 TaxID=2767427 RepID=UPI0018DDDC30|nr:transposase [Thermoactinomyces sp. CICC 10522]MBH8605506.1 transposase [Thermoactinomyces sp. CICC 10522]
MKRRKWTPEEKMNIVLAGLKGDVSIAELCRQHNISQTLYYRWKDTFIQRGLEGLAGKQSLDKEREQLQAKTAEYELLIGKLTVKLAQLKKTLDL